MDKLGHFALVIAVFSPSRISFKLAMLSQDRVGSFHISSKSLFVKSKAKIAGQ